MKTFMKIYEIRFIHFTFCLMVKCSFFFMEKIEIFDKSDFFLSLFESDVYRGYDWTHSSKKNEHGPFDVRKITPDHYQLRAFSEMEDRFRKLLASANYEVFRWPHHYIMETWPNKEAEMAYFQKIMDELRPKADLCFHLTISLHDAQHWSETYRALPLVDFFEEWIVIDTENRQVHMIHLLKD